VSETILITGGAGFIGRNVARALAERGHRVRVLDSLIEQVHGDAAAPAGLGRDVEVIVGDVRDEAAVAKALKGVDKVVHLAAEVGVGQSMYAVDRYVAVNDLGTAVLFQQLIERRVRRVVVASSMSIYGEGLYRTADGDLVEDAVRLPRVGTGRSGRPSPPSTPSPSSCRSA
jgi:dTDP-L-rhamnose 4-epimerase